MEYVNEFAIVEGADDGIQYLPSTIYVRRQEAKTRARIQLKEHIHSRLNQLIFPFEIKQDRVQGFDNNREAFDVVRDILNGWNRADPHSHVIYECKITRFGAIEVALESRYAGTLLALLLPTYGHKRWHRKEVWLTRDLIHYLQGFLVV